MRISVIGAGSWGTTLAALAARSNPVVLWARRPELAETINAQATNPDYMPSLRLPYGLRATADPTGAVDGADAIVVAVPSHGFRDVLERIRGAIADDVPILSLTKGIEMGTGMRMTEVIAQSLPAHDPSISGVLTGPNLAQEIAAGAPAAAVIGMADSATAAQLQTVLMDPTFRIYTNPDVVGCELAGALKNVMAIAAGMAKGLGFGQNTLAALITRALAEITRLGTALGGRPETFAGLAGMGDLIATCESDSSRNNRVGMALARGRRLDDVVSEMQMVAEGVKTVRPVLELADRHGVDMPIASQVARVLYEGAHPREAVLALMTRDARPE
ncbi:MAG: NAD(P)H-dependent glycerol-3-phosphate dehydrogenase [Acidimicrobiia bacterium]